MLYACDQCEYTTTRKSSIKRHENETKHEKEITKRMKYYKMDNLKKDLNARKPAEQEPLKVFGEEEVTKLIEDCKGSSRDILKMFKWMRACFGRRQFAPNIRKLISVKHYIFVAMPLPC